MTETITIKQLEEKFELIESLQAKVEEGLNEKNWIKKWWNLNNTIKMHHQAQKELDELVNGYIIED